MVRTTRGKGEDRALPITSAPRRFCPRNLKPGQVKRYNFKGPLVAYAIACPACGFIDNHADLNDQVGFIEEDGKLVGARKALRCMLCERTISIAGGVIMATLHEPRQLQLPT